MKTSLRTRADAIKPAACKFTIAVVENSKEVKNIGSVIRNVDALGIPKLYVIDPRGALPDTWEKMRTNNTLHGLSVSAVKWRFVKVFKSTEECLAHLKKNGFVSFVTSPHVKGKVNETLDRVDFTKPKKLAIWFGNESRGISDVAVEAAERCVSIPMFGMIESLNLGTSSGIVLYEVARQRRAYQEAHRAKLKAKRL